MIHRILLIVAALFSFSIMQAQYENTLYFMGRIPQSSQLNPAFQPKCNFYFQIPGIFNQISVGNNFLSLNTLFPYNSAIDSVTSFMYDSLSKQNFLASLKDNNKFFFNTQSDLFGFGFRVKSWYFITNVALKTEMSQTLPRDYFRMPINGLKLGDKFDFVNFGITQRVYLETSLSASKSINESLTVGGRFKFLKGIMDVSSSNKKYSISVNEIADPLSANKDNFELAIESDLTINAAMPFLDIPTDSDGIITDSVKLADDIVGRMANLNNTGVGFDLGVTYTGISNLTLSASIIDLGFINWHTGANNFNMKGNYRYTGVEIDPDSLGNAFGNIADSILKSFKQTKTANSYSTSLPTRIYIGAEYSPISFFSVGLLSLSQYYRKQFYQQLTVSASLKPFKMWQFTTSYSIFDNGFSNIGAGVSLCPGPLQTYFVIENFPLRRGTIAGIPWMPYKMQNLTLRFGFNFVFGCSGNKKVNKDKPLLWEE